MLMRGSVRNSNLICPLLTIFELLIKRLRGLITAFFTSVKWLKRLGPKVSKQITYNEYNVTLLLALDSSNLSA